VCAHVASTSSPRLCSLFCLVSNRGARCNPLPTPPLSARAFPLDSHHYLWVFGRFISAICGPHITWFLGGCVFPLFFVHAAAAVFPPVPPPLRLLHPSITGQFRKCHSPFARLQLCWAGAGGVGGGSRARQGGTLVAVSRLVCSFPFESLSGLLARLWALAAPPSFTETTTPPTTASSRKYSPDMD